MTCFPIYTIPLFDAPRRNPLEFRDETYPQKLEG